MEIENNFKIATLLEDQFDAFTRSKAKGYYQRRLVEFIRISDKTAKFQVSGSKLYDVTINYRGKNNLFNATCTCPHFKEGFDCKHIWAVILEADRLKLGPQLLDSNIKLETNSSPNIVTSNIPDWREIIEQAQRKIERDHQQVNLKKSTSAKGLSPRVGMYAVDLVESVERDQIHLLLYIQERLKNGDLGKQKSAELTHEKIKLYEDTQERDFLWDLIGRTEVISAHSRYMNLTNKIDSIALTSGHAGAILQKISEVGKLFRLKERAQRYYGVYDKPELLSYSFSDEKWNFRLQLRKEETATNVYQNFLLVGELVSNQDQTKPLTEVVGATENFVFFKNAMAVSDIKHHFIWYELVKNKPLLLHENELDSFFDFFWSQPGAKTPLELPAEINLLERSDIHPSVQISFTTDSGSSRFAAQMAFDYQGKLAEVNSGRFIYNIIAKEKIIRNLEFEEISIKQFSLMGAISSEDVKIQGYFSRLQFLQVVEKMMALGWQVFALDQRLSQASDFQINFISGIDWFDLTAEVKFGEEIIRLPQLLQALKAGQRMVSLGNGNMGLLPEAWLSRFTQLAGSAKATEGGFRLSKVQALFISASLNENDKFNGDKQFHNLRKIFLDLQNLKPKEPHKLLKGKLRDYQKIGLAWLETIAKNNLGGILADDMGLGKTIQVLALLSGEITAKKHFPSLVLAPKSLVFNWQKEAAVFAPHLKVLIYTGSNRQALLQQIPEYDLVLTTYQTLRNDIEYFQKQKFNFLILDEAHNLKNSRSQITMAAKLIQADKKFALTGTPIENSLLDLFSILSVVNPGLVTDSQAQRWTKQALTEGVQNLTQALRPFLLRRTKEQVLKDLPAKSEQVLYCELSENEKKKYNELKDFYWAQLSDKIEKKGLAKSKIEVLEALLRLRQAACHQGLLDKKFSHLPSAKFELVLEQLETVIRDGHKALIFSQFTSLLALFAERLSGINFEYLDGKTENRAERVENFQTNKNCQVFLLSLKAGGVGLNLTAADYVFILDPWWNPAAESQAIDRTHRIGQTKKVFAYKIIAKDTVEEKILALQEKKRNLAKSIISDDASLFKGMNFEDLRALFL